MLCNRQLFIYVCIYIYICSQIFVGDERTSELEGKEKEKESFNRCGRAACDVSINYFSQMDNYLSELSTCARAVI